MGTSSTIEVDFWPKTLQKNRRKGFDQFHGDKRREELVNDLMVRLTSLQSGLCFPCYFNKPCNFV